MVSERESIAAGIRQLRNFGVCPRKASPGLLFALFTSVAAESAGAASDGRNSELRRMGLVSQVFSGRRSTHRQFAIGLLLFLQFQPHRQRPTYRRFGDNIRHRL
jgi:hypothetical protein